MYGVLNLNGDEIPKNDEAGFHYISQAATMGHDRAALTLGHLYLQAIGCEEDSEEAFHWFMTAAEMGDREAMEMVSRCYEEGYGVEQDFDQCEYWLERSQVEDPGDDDGVSAYEGARKAEEGLPGEGRYRERSAEEVEKELSKFLDMFGSTDKGTLS